MYSRFLQRIISLVLVLSIFGQWAVPAAVFASNPVPPGYTDCGKYVVQNGQPCTSSNPGWFFCMLGVGAASIAAFWAASIFGLIPPWGFAAMTAILTSGTSLCNSWFPPIANPGSPPPATSNPDLTPQPLVRSGSLITGQTQTFTSSIKNTGTANSLAGVGTRLCIDNAACPVSVGGAIASPTLPVLPIGGVSADLSGTWKATAGDHIAYFCVINGNCSQLSFTVVTAGRKDCILDGQVVKNNTSHRSYNTALVPAGQSCLDTDAKNNPLYYQDRTCTNGVLGGSASYKYYSCSSAPTPPQSNLTFSANTTLVRKGESVLLTWDGGNSKSCSLTGTNGFSSSAISGTNVSSSPITQKTTFNLVCTLGSNSKTASITVNLIPSIKEI